MIVKGRPAPAAGLSIIRLRQRRHLTRQPGDAGLIAAIFDSSGLAADSAASAPASSAAGELLQPPSILSAKVLQG